MKELVKYYRRLINQKLDKRRYAINLNGLLVELKNNKQHYPVLLTGFSKSGNTWTRFLILNYFNVLSNKATKTITYKDLNHLCPLVYSQKNGLNSNPGFPLFYWAHSPYDSILRPAFNHFRVVYLYRHPLDCLISLFYWRRERTVPFVQYHPFERPRLKNIDYFVLFELDRWIAHYKSTVDKAFYVLSYEALQKDTYREIHGLFSRLDFPISEEAMKLTIELSSAESIKAMGRKSGQEKGEKGKNKSFVQGFEFIRSSKVGQFREELHPDTVATVIKILEENGINLMQN